MKCLKEKEKKEGEVKRGGVATQEGGKAQQP
jgi:hypothetical protein